MCTAVSFCSADHYFGRTLDLEYSYQESVTVTPRHFPLAFRHMGTQTEHYALIGMAYVAQGCPLYYDAVNEKGLGMAGLNFPDNAHYFPYQAGRDNVAPFELIPWVLGQCADLAQARSLLQRLSVLDEAFSPQLPASPLHWMVADASGALVVESMADGLHIHDDPVGVMTNNPPFDYHMTNLSNYMALSVEPPENRMGVPLAAYSRGMGGLGLPGDLSSASRFVKAAFTKMHSLCKPDEASSVSQFFHILGAVDQQRGCVHMGEGQYEITIYTSCCNTAKGIYYYTTYDNHQLSAVDMHREDLDGEALAAYPLHKEMQINWHN